MRRNILPAILLALFTSTALCDAPATRSKVPPIPAGAKLLRDIPYVTGPGDHDRQKLDIITLATEKPAPLIVWVHGGGWITGSKNILRVVNFTREGYAVAAINYRLSLHAPFPAQIEDCKSAIRFLRAHAKKYDIDPDRIGVWGESAGGHLVALLGTSGGNLTLAGDKPQNADQSDRVQCVVDYFGPTDLLQIPAMAGPDVKYDFNGPNSLLTRFLGGPMSTKHHLATIANPITHISKDDPPFLIVHGTADPIVPIGQSKILYQALKKAGIEAEMISVKGASHGLGIYGDPEVTTRVKSFFEKHLRPEMPKPAAHK
jgi:acetyl esterase/lipase